MSLDLPPRDVDEAAARRILDKGLAVLRRDPALRRWYELYDRFVEPAGVAVVASLQIGAALMTLFG